MTARRFNNFEERDLGLAILDQSPVAEAKLLRKFKQIRFHDDDVDPELLGTTAFAATGSRGRVKEMVAGF